MKTIGPQQSHHNTDRSQPTTSPAEDHSEISHDCYVRQSRVMKPSPSPSISSRVQFKVSTLQIPVTSACTGKQY